MVNRTVNKIINKACTHEITGSSVYIQSNSFCWDWPEGKGPIVASCVIHKLYVNSHEKAVEA